ncbi:MAG: hypothetical protein GTO55_04510 [Armatimonadetes bacterium]|nr:hypothetical protein [Armatimonadota bacterium]NIM23529.1 hypothetical protein [Armatimonadota bacterium]NIM67395.1 hypothetical protein [Armatimonadota bacterium]NIM75896.1 hypothetical protein [Armatimonadota bacterium]NIN05581.1 hypothetical protein [Armatimonadota bacterium]
MFKLKKGDIWKAVVLVILIAATCVFAYWRISKAIARPALPGVPAVAKKAAATGPAEEVSSGEEMFATRPRMTPSELAKAHTAPDPFRPEVSERGRARPPAASPTDSPPAEVSPAAGLWLTGVIYSERPLAIVREGEGHYFVRRGDSLPGGWKVASIGPKSITLTRADQRLSLQVSPPPTTWPTF